MKYHLNKPGSKELDGPHGLTEVLDLLEKEKYGPTDNVWNAEKKTWQLVKEVPALNRKLKEMAVSPEAITEEEGKHKPIAEKAVLLKNAEKSETTMAGIKQKLVQKKDELAISGKKALQDKVLQDIEVRKSKIEFSFGDFKLWLVESFGNLFGRLPNKRWPNVLYLVLYLVPTIFFSVVSAGLLMGPLSAGYLLILLGILNGKATKFRFGDLFTGDRFFVRTFWIGVLLNSITFAASWGIVILMQEIEYGLIGLILSIALIGLTGLFIAAEFFAFMLILERDQKWNEALLHSFGFLKGGIIRVVPVTGLMAAASLGLGLVAFYIGLVITIPFYVLFMILLFRHCSCQYFGYPAIEIDQSGIEQIEEASTQ